MDYNKLANLLFPEITKSVADYEAHYPARELPPEAKVTRLGPSPTGFIHLGNLYGAFADERLAHQSQGVFILRIEDTDDKRKVEGSEEIIINSLDYFGIHFDEGATLDGEKGAYGPYCQSNRVALYQTIAKHLVEMGCAYPSFATAAELDEIRQQQEAQKLLTGYYGEWATDRNLTEAAIEAKLSAGEPWVLRLLSQGDPSETRQVADGIRKSVQVHPNNMDAVLLKTNGVPTYHFAHVVDDHFMRITHVVRGEEWLSTLPIHLELFETLGWQHPVYCHTAHMMKMDGETKRKLSKRKDPEMSLSYYGEVGHFPEAVREYLMTLLNSNFEEWRLANPALSLEDFPFSLDHMSTSGALFDMNKLNDVAKDVLLQMTEEAIADFLIDWATKHQAEAAAVFTRDRDKLIKILAIGRDEKKPRKDLEYGQQIFDFIKYFFDEWFVIADELPENVDAPEAKAILADYLATYDQQDDNENWFGKIRAITENRGYAVKMKDYKKHPEDYKGHVGDVSTVVRLAITGRRNSPDVWTIQQILGETCVLARINNYLEKLN
ncbi:glutamate--tRNA ligase [Acetobacterium fimetarium]|uniref:Glutamate--tRNA ligase n=1 Tax=Acetobacterium fimetarium TaxID=52691 RepID=A0ABR6WUY6_9FIRM|nr:glutamate--tRNA ligase [Acetobacterium fimetarium]MBC3804238.1 glutamate--tRNA ligase [Acetobacterium fimetarium]